MSKRIQSRKGWFFFQIGGDFFHWFLAIGQFSISWEKK